MTFAESIKKCLSNYAAFAGRAGRPEYWWFLLFVLVCSAVLGIIDRAIFGVDPITQTSNGFFGALFSLAVFIPSLAVGWRRMHDTGKPGWYLLLPLLLSVGVLGLLVFGVLGFSGLENAGVDPDTLRLPAAMFGFTGIILVLVLQLGFVILLLWWLTRPSDPDENAFGQPLR